MPAAYNDNKAHRREAFNPYVSKRNIINAPPYTFTLCQYTNAAVRQQPTYKKL